ncbi:MAG: fused MFS/spermidine synthase, partial [Planctomycetota bacterium]|nr:fused MFS/spermidine synthase [Planctomycetota bacterium]
MRAAGDLAAVNETRPAAPTDALPTGKTETPKASAEPKSESKADPKNDAKPAAKAESKKDAAPTPKRPYPPDLSKAKLRTLFLGGGAYTFPRYLQDKYKGTQVDVAEIDPAVTKANLMATGLKPEEGPIVTTWGDARQFVENNQGKKQYDVIFGDAFNDFSVPWHLTTREFNDKL